ncbi:beta-lactamase/transpeptidase-like protein [Astrocystis sublimbata]|nr:beta-lactamase/transpeptidase-like protein [Astrocystis sublimbata]
MFRVGRALTWLVALQALGTDAKKNCPIYGLGYPKPSNLLDNDGIKSAASALDTVLSRYIDRGNGTGSQRYSYSVEVFSANEPESIYSHYWTAPNLATMNTTGTKKIDGDTVYRTGSLTKIFTILTFLAEVGDASWNEPIGNFIPEIAEMAASQPDVSHSLSAPDWGSITIGSLASQISGLMRDYALLGELTLVTNKADTLGFPALSPGDIPPCGTNPVCNRAQFFAGLMKLPPAFSPFVTPAYSDIAYVLLGYALEKMTGKPFQQSFEEKLVKPLNLTRTFYTTPEDKLGVIPGNRYGTTWAFNMGNESPTGNIYSSAKDMATVGKAILKSTLLPWPVTRRWLRPVTYSSDPSSSVGSPWGVRRLTIPGQNSTYQFATTFNKLGSLGRYSALLAVIPDLDIGFSIAAAGELPASLVLDIADTLSNTYLPTILSVARSQANATYAGNYVSENTSVNSSLSITVDPQMPGLGVGPWLSNSTNMMGLVVALAQNVSSDYWAQMRPSVRLFPTGLWDELPEGGRKVGFKATFEDLALPEIQKPFTTDCSTWISLSATAYGSRALDSFIFEFDKEGKVVALENAALRNRMVKVG